MTNKDYKMTLDCAIQHAQETADSRTDLCEDCRAEHQQLANWLRELRDLKSKKMREDEFHKTTIKITPFTLLELTEYQATAFCSVCGMPVIHRTSDTEGTAMLYAAAAMPNYCSNCGARLKKVENDE